MNNARNIVVLTGAGISAESGLATFRGAGGLWEGFPVEEIATIEALRRNPAKVNAFYNARWDGVRAVQPNAAHLALAQLAQGPHNLLVVTQNIDDLHERAGQPQLIHMHGEINKLRCDACGAVQPRLAHVQPATICQHCAVPNNLRPHIVLFGEIPLQMDEIEQALRACDLFISIGTSGQVYPAAGFVQAVRQMGRAHTIELNLDFEEGPRLFHERRMGPATKTVPELVQKLLG